MRNQVVSFLFGVAVAISSWVAITGWSAGDASLDVPPGHKAFVSELYGLGFAYPEEFELKPDRSKTIGTLKISEDRSNISISLESLQGDVLAELSRDEARDAILKSNVATITLLFADVELLGRVPYSMRAIKGEKVRLQLKREVGVFYTIQVVIPHFENHAIYYFTLTSSPEHLERDEAVFDEFLSTVRFF